MSTLHVYVYILVHPHTCIPVCTHRQSYINTYIHVRCVCRIHMDTYICARTHVCAYIYVVCACIRMYIYMHTYVCIGIITPEVGELVQRFPKQLLRDQGLLHRALCVFHTAARRYRTEVRRTQSVSPVRLHPDVHIGSHIETHVYMSHAYVEYIWRRMHTYMYTHIRTHACINCVLLPVDCYQSMCRDF